MERQYKLFRQLKKPRMLADVVTREKLALVPETPGVYIFHGPSPDEILYVGKAKNLRNRLKSYRYRGAEKVSRKWLRFSQRARGFRYEMLPDEERALLRENELLRRHKPAFNRLNVGVDYYSYLIAEKDSSGRIADFSVSIGFPKVGEASDEIFGPFKSARKLRAVLKSLKNLIKSEILLHESLQEFLRGEGASDRFDELKASIDRIRETACPLKLAQLDYDLEEVKLFWENSLSRRRELLKKFGIDRSYLFADEYDDLVVRHRHGKARDLTGP